MRPALCRSPIFKRNHIIPVSRISVGMFVGYILCWSVSHNEPGQFFIERYCKDQRLLLELPRNFYEGRHLISVSVGAGDQADDFGERTEILSVCIDLQYPFLF